MPIHAQYEFYHKVVRTVQFGPVHTFELIHVLVLFHWWKDDLEIKENADKVFHQESVSIDDYASETSACHRKGSHKC